VVLGEEFPALVSGVTEVDVTLFSAELVEEEVAVDFVEHGVVFAGGGGFAFDVASVAFLPDVDSEGLVVPAACDLVVEARVVDVYKLDEVEFVVYSCSFSLVVVSGARCPRSFSCCSGGCSLTPVAEDVVEHFFDFGHCSGVVHVEDFVHFGVEGFVACGDALVFELAPVDALVFHVEERGLEEVD